MISHQYTEMQWPAGTMFFARAYLPDPGKSTRLLMYCDGCGTYSAITVPGVWDLAELDPAFPAAVQGPADVR
jgi:hypothetical protein